MTCPQTCCLKMSKAETLVGWNLNSDHPLSRAKHQPTANTPWWWWKPNSHSWFKKCAYLIKVRISQSSHWWEQAILGFQDNTHITRTQPGSLTRKGIAMYFFLQTTNYRLCSDSGIRITLLSAKLFNNAILNTATSHSHQLCESTTFPVKIHKILSVIPSQTR